MRGRRTRRQQEVLDVLEGMRMLCSMLGLVFISLTVSLVGTLRGDEMSSGGYFAFDLVTCLIFSAEMCTRMWALNSFRLFFTDGISCLGR